MAMIQGGSSIRGGNLEYMTI